MTARGQVQDPMEHSTNVGQSDSRADDGHVQGQLHKKQNKTESKETVGHKKHEEGRRNHVAKSFRL